MNELKFADKVRHILNRGLDDLDPATAERLRLARSRALQRQRPEPVRALAWADHVLGRVDGWGSLSLRVLAPLALLIAAALAIGAWQQNQRIAENEEIDVQLLTDELPIDAYLDRGFQSWLKKRAAEQ